MMPFPSARTVTSRSRSMAVPTAIAVIVGWRHAPCRVQRPKRRVGRLRHHRVKAARTELQSRPRRPLQRRQPRCRRPTRRFPPRYYAIPRPARPVRPGRERRLLLVLVTVRECLFEGHPGPVLDRPGALGPDQRCASRAPRLGRRDRAPGHPTCEMDQRPVRMYFTRW